MCHSENSLPLLCGCRARIMYYYLEAYSHEIKCKIRVFLSANCWTLSCWFRDKIIDSCLSPCEKAHLYVHENEFNLLRYYGCIYENNPITRKFPGETLNAACRELYTNEQKNSKQGYRKFSFLTFQIQNAHSSPFI